MFVGFTLPSTNLAFDFAALDDFEEEPELDFGEEGNLDFFRFCFFLTGGSSDGGMSLNISDPDCCRMDSPKSVYENRNETKEMVENLRFPEPHTNTQVNRHVLEQSIITVLEWPQKHFNQGNLRQEMYVDTL